jgi:hypothetical protein
MRASAVDVAVADATERHDVVDGCREMVTCERWVEVNREVVAAAAAPALPAVVLEPG